MLKKIFIRAFFCYGIWLAAPAVAAPPAPDGITAGKLPSLRQTAGLLFTENRGQVADQFGKRRPEVLFTARSGAADIYLTGTGIHYQFTRAAAHDRLKTGHIPLQTHRCSVVLEGADPQPEVRREQPARFTENFYLPHCPEGITGVPTWEKLVYKEVYPHIDWVLYSRDNKLKYDFVVRPGGDPARIRLRISDAENVSITPEGELLLKTRLGEVREQAPVSFADGEEVPTRFKRNPDGTIGFDVAPPPGDVLTIDPSVSWATYYGAAANDLASGCAVDAAGNMFLAGSTLSATGMASGGFQLSGAGNYDNFLVKFDAAGNRLWATYYGGTGNDQNNGCAADAAGNVYIAGFTNSVSVIASGGFQNTFGGAQDAFLVKFSPAGARLWGTYYGGTGSDGTGINSSCATDASGNVYLTGQTNSAAGIASGGMQNTIGGGNDAFLVKFDAAGNRLWGTYYGGSSFDIAYKCATDGTNVYIAGATMSSSGIATANGFQTVYGGASDAMFVKFDAAGNRLWATYYGGAGDDYGSGCGIDAGGNVYFAGYTNSASGIAGSGYQNVFAGSTDAFLVKFTSAGARLWGTYYGGTGDERGFGGCVPDAAGNVYLSGWSSSASGVATPAAFQTTYGGGAADGFIARFTPAGGLMWGTYYGGPGADQPYDATMDAAGNFYIAGYTASASGIAYGGYQNAPAGGSDGFLAKISDAPVATILTGTLSSTLCTGGGVSVPFSITGAYNTGNVFTAQLSDASGSFASPVNIGTLSGTASGTISAVIPAGTATGAGYRIRVVSSSPSVTGSDNGVNLTVSSAVLPAVTITASPNDTVCAGINVTFTAVPANGGTAPQYQWRKNGADQAGATGVSYSTTGLANNDVISVRLTSNAACRNTDTVNSNSIAMTVNSNVTPSVTVTVSPDDTVCTGASVTFTATTANGGSTPGFAWRINGTSVPGATAGTYTTATLSNNDVVTVRLTSNAGCRTADTVSSAGIAMTVNPVTAPAVTISANPGNTVCAGTQVTFSAIASNGGPAPAYQWKRNGTNVGTNSSGYTATPVNGDIITCTVTSSSPCSSTPAATSNSITMAVTPTVTPAITVAANPGNTVCAGTAVTFTAAITNGGTTPVYQWTKGTTVVGTNSPVYTDNALANGDIITCSVTSNAPCAMTTPVAGTSITMTVNPLLTPAAAITVLPSDTVCPGTLVSFTATGANLGTAPVYQWKRNGANTGTNSPVFSSATLGNNDVITCEITSSIACPTSPAAISNGIRMTIDPAASPTIIIAASPGSRICAGTPVTLSGMTTRAGATPVYQWRKNGMTVSTAPTYSSSTLMNGDSIICLLGSSVACVANPVVRSNSIIMSVNYPSTPAVTITASPGTTISPGTTVTFVANVTGNGGTYTCQWTRNRANIPGATGHVYVTGTLANGDTISCVVNRNAACQGNEAQSNPLVIRMAGTAVASALTGAALRLFPNPNTGAFRLKGLVPGAKELEMDIVNTVGQSVYRTVIPVSNGAIDQQITLRESIPGGTYLLHIRSAGAVSAIRFVIVR